MEVNAERNVERVVFETGRQLIVGEVTLPPSGYQSRLSDLVNRDAEFVALTDVEITSLEDGSVTKRPFALLAKAHVRLAYPAED
ncbi:MAG TPA: hypothetical protein VFN85_08825 [Solirubrobacterales bacterium]|jgi:hypothetical protein|nr:hypothetical protein [Solirubrobacterales bacterium]